MSASQEPLPNLPQVPDDGPKDPVERRRQTLWMVILCLVLIIVTAALIVNELRTSGPGG